MTPHDSHPSFLQNLLSQSYEIETSEESDIESISQHEHRLVDEEDIEILMHRDAHFGGSFAIMLDVYKKDGRGAVLNTTVKRIQRLKDEQERLKKDLAPLLLSGKDAEKIAIAKKMYATLRDGCTKSVDEPSLAAIHLILAEKNELAEIRKRILSFKEKAIAPLCQIVSSSELKDPLFPGYGRAPLEAIKLLGKLKSQESIPFLFEAAASKENAFFETEYEEEVAKSLLRIGKRAQDFLMKLLESSPFTSHHEMALLFLLRFRSKEISPFCFELLKKYYKKLPFALYCCFGITQLPPTKQKEFEEFKMQKELPQEVVEELKKIKPVFKKS